MRYSTGGGRRDKKDPKKSRRNQWLALAAIILVVGGTAAYALTRDGQDSQTTQTTQAEVTTTTVPKPVTRACPLDGVQADPDLIERQPVAVVIENHPAARPQSGLSKADLVYEVVAEGGITRFLAIYLHGEAPRIGPVRSVREYFAELAYSYGAALAHCGGSPSGYETVKSLGVDDLDQFKYESSYERDGSRRAPHNLYSSSQMLRELMESQAFSTPQNIPSFSFKSDAPKSERPAGQIIDVNFSQESYRVKWTYDPKTNTYQRSIRQFVQRDLNNNVPLAARNIAVLTTSIRTVDQKLRVKVDLSSGGRAVVFRDGTAVTGTWTREAGDRPIRLIAEDGTPIELNRGKTWIEIIDSNNRLSY